MARTGPSSYPVNRRWQLLLCPGSAADPAQCPGSEARTLLHFRGHVKYKNIQRRSIHFEPFQVVLLPNKHRLGQEPVNRLFELLNQDSIFNICMNLF